MRFGFMVLGWGLLAVGHVYAESSPWLLGDWQGTRTRLAEKGIDFEFALTLEGVQNVSGGIARSSRGLLNLDLVMDAQGQALGLSEQGDLHVYFLGNAGGNPTAMVGDVQATSNIEAPETFKLYELWWRQRLIKERLSVLAGLHDYNAMFDALTTAGLFTNSSFGIGPDISQVSPSIFPTTSLAAVVSVTGDRGVYLHAGLYDGVPGDPDDDQGTHVILKHDDGIFYALETGIENPETGTKLGIGGWFRSTDFETDFSSTSHRDNHGLYLLAETALSDAWAGFVRVGYADKDRNQVGRYIGSGLTYSGWLMEEDHVGLALAYAHASRAYRDATPAADDYEMVVEAAYQWPLADWLTLQPDIQWVKNPGMDQSLDDALVLAIRAMIAF